MKENFLDVPGLDTPYPALHDLCRAHEEQDWSFKTQYILGLHPHLDIVFALQFWMYTKPLAGLREKMFSYQ